MGAIGLYMSLKTKFPNFSNHISVNHEFVKNIINIVEGIEVASADKENLWLSQPSESEEI